MNDIEYLNFAEATVSLPRVEGDKLWITTENLNVMQGAKSHYLRGKIGLFLQQVDIVFNGVRGYTLDYEESRKLDPKKRICIGGDLQNGIDHIECWFEYESANIDYK